MITIESLDKVSYDIIFTGFSEAFRSYEFQLNKDQLLVMLRRRGFVRRRAQRDKDSDSQVFQAKSGAYGI